MKAHGLSLARHAGGVSERRHDGRIAVAQSNLRWCSDGFELPCENGEKVRVAFALDCCDREAIGYVTTTQGIKGEDVRDLMTIAVESRFAGWRLGQAGPQVRGRLNVAFLAYRELKPDELALLIDEGVDFRLYFSLSPCPTH